MGFCDSMSYYKKVYINLKTHKEEDCQKIIKNFK